MNENVYKMLFSLNSYKNLIFKINYIVAEMPYWKVSGDVREGRNGWENGLGFVISYSNVGQREECASRVS